MIVAVSPVDQNTERLPCEIRSDWRNDSSALSPSTIASTDDGRGRRHAEGQRQQDRHAVGAAQARQHADDHAQHDADQHVQKVVPALVSG